MKNKLQKTPKAFGNSAQEKFSLEMLTLLNIFRSVSSAGLSWCVLMWVKRRWFIPRLTWAFLNEPTSSLPSSSLASPATGRVVCKEQAAFLRKWALAPEQCPYWYLNVIWKFWGHLGPFSFLTPQDLILTLTQLNLWPAISCWIWPFHSVFITRKTGEAVFPLLISSGNGLDVAPPWLFMCGFVSTNPCRSLLIMKQFLSKIWGPARAAEDLNSCVWWGTTSASCNTNPALTGRTLHFCWPEETGILFLTICLNWHLFQYKEKYKFRNELKVFSGSVIGPCSQLEAELHQVCFPAEKSAAGLGAHSGNLWSKAYMSSVFASNTIFFPIEMRCYYPWMRHLRSLSLQTNRGKSSQWK